MKFSLKRMLSAALPAAALMIGPGGAHAAIYKGSWDPAFGPALPNLGWSGEVTLDISGSCSAIGTSYSASTCGASITGLTVSLYDLSNPNSILQTLTFTNLLPSGYLSTFEFATATNLELNTAGALTDLILGNINETKLIGGQQAAFALGFSYATGQTGGPTLRAFGTGCDSEDDVPGNDSDGDCVVQASSFQSDPNAFRYAQAVPEPASLALVGLGLLACVSMGGTRTRTRRLGHGTTGSTHSA